MMKLEDKINEIENRKHHHAGLDMFLLAMDELGNPQDGLKSIHVGGTNGKGSTTDFLRSVLNQAGYKVGTFTSPYLVCHQDRIRIDNVNISDEKLLSYIQMTEYLWDKYDLSMFEIDMMIASLYFKDEDVDFAIFEVGLGGRIDATNILSCPLVSVITNIGLDHTQFLGDTYEKIAYEKAGIIKKRGCCISGEVKRECLDVFEKCCDERGSLFLRVDDVEVVEGGFVYKDRLFTLKSKALYQVKNASLAVCVIDYLNDCCVIDVDERTLIDGIGNTQWLGRFEIVHTSPLVILDGAHNVEGICALVDSMKGYSNVHVLFTCLRDKNGKRMLEELMKISDDITVCEFDFYRAQSVCDLAFDSRVRVCLDWKSAIEEGLCKEGVFLICGSLYFISEVRRYFLKFRDCH